MEPILSFYIASKLQNHHIVHQWIQHLEKTYNWRCTFDWTTFPPLSRLLLNGSLTHEFKEQAREISQQELDGVKSADFLLLLAPGGRGTHVELGAALACNRPVFLFAEQSEEPYGPTSSPAYPCVFHHHPNVEIHYGPFTTQWLDRIVGQHARRRVLEPTRNTQTVP